VLRERLSPIQVKKGNFRDKLRLDPMHAGQDERPSEAVSRCLLGLQDRSAQAHQWPHSVQYLFGLSSTCCGININ
jgi:hypothetical protein